MGYSIDLFTDPNIDEEFQCSICHDVLKDPRVLNPCEHQFCSTCIMEWWKKSHLCPCCRSVATTKNSPRPFLKLLNKLEMRCPYTENGCKAVRLEEVADHDLKCEFNPQNQIECDGGCEAVLSQFERKSGAHNCVQHLKRQCHISGFEFYCKQKKLVAILQQKEELLTDRESKLEESEQQLQETQEKLKSTELQLRETQAQLAEAKYSKEKLKEMISAFRAIQEQLEKSLRMIESEERAAGEFGEGPADGGEDKQEGQREVEEGNVTREVLGKETKKFLE